MKTLLEVIILVISLAALWQIFKKMGLEGWNAIIPFYNLYKEFEVLYGNGWRFLLILIPLYNIYVIFKLNIDLANRFGQSTAFGVGLTLVSVVFQCMLGFGDYQFDDGSRAITEEDFVDRAFAGLKNLFSKKSN